MLDVIGFLLIGFGIFFVGVAKLIQRRSSALKKINHIPDGEIIYSDLHEPAQPLFSSKHRLTGKPDYIVKQNDTWVPVEFKTGVSQHPHTHHIMQLAAYCQLIEDTSNSFVPHGYLVYPNHHHTIQFNPKIRFELESTMKTMRTMQKKHEIIRNHNEPKKCIHCSMRQYCQEKLV